MRFLDAGGLERFFQGLKNVFLRKSQVVNTLTATAEGSVLDARQGKVLNEKKAETALYEATFSSSGWKLSGSVYTQTVNVSGLKAADSPVIDVKLNGESNQTQLLEQWGKIARAVCADGTLTAYSLEKTYPTRNVKVLIKVVK